MFNLISLSPARSIFKLFLAQNYELNQGYEVVSASKEHDGKGEEYRKQKAEVDDKEERFGNFLVWQIWKEISVIYFSNVVISHYPQE